MDGLSAAASVIAVVEAAAFALKYASSVARSDKDRSRLESEVGSLQALMAVFEPLVNAAKDRKDGVSAGAASLAEDGGLLTHIKVALQELEEPLLLRLKESSKWREMVKRLKWPLDQKDCSEIMLRIHRLVTWTQLLLVADLQ